MSTSTKTANDVTISLNGFDEIAIAQRFGEEWTALHEKRSYRFIRALIFVEERRNGSKDADAFKTAMNLTTLEVGEYFVEEPAEDPESDLGNDDEPSP